MSSTLVDNPTDFDTLKDITDSVEVQAAPADKAAKHVQVKPTIKKEDIPEELRSGAISAADVVRIADQVTTNLRDRADSDEFDPSAPMQVIKKKKAPVVDFSKLSLDDIYNMDINIEAKPFMGGDPLKIELKDTNYIARWVKTLPQRLGYMIAIGFMYIVQADLLTPLEGVVGTNAEGHYTIDDVVAMRIEKSKYFGAMRAAHERSLKATSSLQTQKMGAKISDEFLRKNAGSEYADALAQGKIEIYKPSVSI